MDILITGGAGYIGTTLVPQLLALGHSVTVLDSLKFGGDALMPFFRNPKFSFIKGDVRNSELLRECVRKSDVVVHLAAIVGYPACAREPELAQQVNVDATRELSKMVSNEQLVLFGSTGSNYGALVDGVCTEDSPLNPLSHYGATKTEAEKIIMNGTKAVAYRFATAFGVSPRLRLDLLINDFVSKALNDKYIVVYESHFMRTFIHVHDIARSFVFAIQNQDKMVHNVYNVGNKRMNRSKGEICDLISSKVDYYLHKADYEADADKRNYVVSYDKIGSQGFDTTVSIEQGIDELVNAMQAVNFTNRYKNV